MTFNESPYLTEMRNLLVTAAERWAADHADVEIYSINIWTDANSAVGAVSIDTFANSCKQVDKQNQWPERQREYHMANGDPETALLFQLRAGRNHNPADFAFTKFAIVEVIVRRQEEDQEANIRYPLRRKPYRYDDPFDGVAIAAAPLQSR